ncbi:DUF202 domain-containing protein [Couchioplanes azureus]|uniref:DUF202 domain-containing protein n=1 Tax=Couchioplanes caeruleus TaxID=56438 RepID=UPI0019B12EAA|nr:DUF202 domain-containing protein [Couchioplanes caeruleus]GGQ38493.1 hypothetical protein GCM10010166_01170 [Couchioplanes caeruleus subsp. azureus]
MTAPSADHGDAVTAPSADHGDAVTARSADHGDAVTAEPAPGYVRDPGASAERTRLAWRRTGMSATAVALLAARPAFAPHARPAVILLAALAMAGWAVLVALAYRRAHWLAVWPPRPGRRTVTCYAMITAAFSLLGTALVLL